MEQKPKCATRKAVKWTIQYKKKGDNTIRTEVVDVHFDKKNDVKKWWLSKTSTFIDNIGSKTIGGYRQDNEWVNCIKLKNDE
jgi:hypothetical protein